jgi:hypothetical protein
MRLTSGFTYRHKSQLKELENKLEHIAKVLSNKTANETLNVSSSSTSASQHVDEDSHPATSVPQLTAPSNPTATDFVSTVRQSSRCEDVQATAQPFSNPEEIEVLFERYQRLMAPHMPFVILPADTTALALQQSEPFLMQAIAVVASFHNTTRQQGVAKAFTRDLCDRLLINGEKSLGLLQGLLIFSNWYNPHLYTPRNSTTLLHFAMALTTDLNIDRGPSEKAQMDAAMKAYGVAKPAKRLTNDELRAVLGTFYLTSVLFTSFKKVDLMQWTPWLTKCANMLAEAPEYESDSHLLQLVNTQRIMQEAVAVEHSNVPVQLYAKSLLAELDAPRATQEHGITVTVLRLQEACARIAVWQRAFVGLTGGAIEPSALRQRLDSMWHCMEAVKAYIDIYMTVSVEDYPVVSFTIFAQFAYTFVIMVRSCSVQLDGWNAHDTINFSAVMDDASRRYDSVSQTHVDGHPLRNEAFSAIAAKLRQAKTFHDTTFRSAMPEAQVGMNAHSDDCIALAAVSTQHFLTPSDATVGAPIDSMVDFEYFWNGFDDPSQLWTDFEPGYNGMR